MIIATLVLILGVILICIGFKIIDTCYYERIPVFTIFVGIGLTVTGIACLFAGGANQELQQTETYCTCAVEEIEYCKTCGNIIIEEVQTNEPT